MASLARPTGRPRLNDGRDDGAPAASSIVRAVKLRLLEPLHIETRLSTMEVLLHHHLRSRAPADDRAEHRAAGTRGA